MSTCEFNAALFEQDYDGHSHIYIVPERIAGAVVTSVGERTFYGHRALCQVILPDSVEQIGSYAFAECRGLLKMNFPSKLKSVGDYCFYNCMNLKAVSFGAAMGSIGYGAFKNCLELGSVNLELAYGKKNCLNAILQDAFQEIDLTLKYLNSDGRLLDTASLVFTEYQYEYVPEIEARQFNWETYGSGDSYRVSVRDHDIDYDKYDSVFPVAVIEDDEMTVLKIAAGRLLYPYRLSDHARSRYENWIKGHMPQILDVIISGTYQKLMDYMIDHELMDKNALDLAQKKAQAARRPQLTALLMDYQKRRYPAKTEGIHKTFDL